MPETHHHTGSQTVAQALREALPVPTRTRVYVLTCGCPEPDGRRMWNIDTETRSYELVLLPDRPGLQAARLTSEPLLGDGTVWAAEFLVRDISADWARSLAQLVARLALADGSPLSLS